MLFGAKIKNIGDTARLDEIEAKLMEDDRIEGQAIKKAPVLFANLKPGQRYPALVMPAQIIHDRLIGVWQGEIYNRMDYSQWQDGVVEGSEREQDEAQLFAKCYLSQGKPFLKCLNGRFVFALYEDKNQEVVLGRDHLGVETLYVYEDDRMFVFCSKIDPILETPGVRKELNFDALRRSLIFSYNPSWDTLISGIRKVKPGCVYYLSSKGIEEEPYWYLSYKDIQQREEAEIVRAMQGLFADAVSLRMQSSTSPGVFVSGGLDSSGVACLMRKSFAGSITSFSYRTLQVSFDESVYARKVADACKFEHHEVVYNPNDVKLIETIVQVEDEPFCNLGITVASFLLGREAQGLAGQVFCGSGGDELFGGHPVYIADKIATYTDRIPQALKSPVISLFRQLPDSDKKLNMTVKLKRFSESLSYLKELGTFRWRIYYNNDELNQLFVHDLAINSNHYISLFSDVLAEYQEADGKDALSRSLYVDFKTEVSSHMRLKDLVRYFGVQPIFPMLDYRLVEYAATVPSSLKIRGYADSKYIEKLLLDGIIPDQILNRKDKLGHSIPFKNWLRSDPVVQGLVQDVLSESNVTRRGLFNAATIKKMWNNHQTLQENNSHRLWMLTVLELWLTANGF